MMKILIFNWRDIKNPEGGGAEVFTHEIARRLLKKGNEVTLFTSEFDDCKKEEFVDGVRIVRAGRKYSVYWKAEEYYKKYFSKEGYDVVIDSINTRPFFTPKFVRRGEKVVALIYQLAREYWFYETPFPINLLGYYLLENRWLKSYVEIPTITISESTKKDLIGLGFKKISVVFAGLGFRPLKKVPKKYDNPVIIYLGRLKKAKRPDHVVEAFRIIKRKISNAELWVVGSGYLSKHLQKISPEGVKLFGHIPEEEKRNLLAKAWVSINPSVREGWGINIIEANALGTPSIAYDVPGLRDSIMDGKTGVLVKENGNVEMLAEATIDILENKDLREKLSKNALGWSKQFSWNKSAQEFEKVIETVVNE